MRYDIPISVIMPVKNGERFIEIAVNSILCQTFENFELIIIDDGSTDGTKDIIQNIEDSRIIYSKVNFSNNYKARNFGISISKGKYICMMDSDDISFNDRLEKQFKYLEGNKHIGVLGAQMNLINEHNKQLKTPVRRQTEDAKIKVWLLKNIQITQPTLMFRSQIFREHGLEYDTNFTYAGDYELMVRLSHKYGLGNLKEPLVQYRRHTSQISTLKSVEQARFANQVKEMQLKKFNLEISDDEIKLHLKLMNGKYLNEKDLTDAEEWLNRLLDANYELKIYHPKHLYDLFEFVLANAIKKNTWVDGESKKGYFSLLKKIFQKVFIH